MVQNNGDNYPANGAEKVGIVINGIARLFGGIGAINQVKYAEQHRRDSYRQGEYIHSASRIEQNAAENYGANSARSPQAMVPKIVFVFNDGGQIAQNHAGYI